LVDFCQKRKASIISLNYDNTIELACNSNGISVNTGIISWAKSGKLSFPDDSLSLIKLHGSINWFWSPPMLDGTHPIEYQEIVELTNINDIKKKRLNPAIIFGGKNKLTAKGPFLALLRAFEEKLEHIDHVVIIGYSFSDDHVNQFIGKWLNSNPRNMITIINPAYKEINNYFTKQLEPLLGTRVTIIQENAAEGIQQFLYMRNPKKLSTSNNSQTVKIPKP
jgi:NAD-dependent SIR2 family protein deacetylase